MANSLLDIRWKQRLNSFDQAFLILVDAVKLAQARALSDLEKQGLVQSFEFTHEISWNVLKDYFEYQGTVGIAGSRDAAREAFQKGLISDGEAWMEMIKSRNQTTHTYNKKTADEIVDKILKVYFKQFEDFQKKMHELAQKK